MLSIHTFCCIQFFVLAGSEGSDQTAQMRRLIWTFAVRIGPNTRFRMAWPICCWSAVLIFNATGHPRRMKAVSNAACAYTEYCSRGSLIHAMCRILSAAVQERIQRGFGGSGMGWGGVGVQSTSLPSSHPHFD